MDTTMKLMDMEEMKKISGGEEEEELQPYDEGWIRSLIRLYKRSGFTKEDIKTSSYFDNLRVYLLQDWDKY